MRKLFSIILICLLVFGCVACKGKETSSPNDLNENEQTEDKEAIDLSALMPIAVFTMDDGAVFEVELYKEVAPLTVNNFVKLAKSGFYNGTLIHRITKSGIYVIQGGGFFLDEDNNRYEKAADKIKGEFAANGVENNFSHTRGVISMARGDDYNSGSSQFFICYENSDSLDERYAAFGQIRSGMEIINAIAATPSTQTQNGYAPNENVIIKTVTLKYINR